MEKKVTHYESGYLYNRLKEAINEGDKEKAFEIIDALSGSTKHMQDAFMENLSILFTFVADKLGKDAVSEVWQIMGDDVFKPAVEKMKTGETTYEEFCDFTEVEDNEKVDFIMHQCGFCKSIMCNHKLDRQPGDAPFKVGSVKEAHPWNLGYKGMPYYCCHAPRLFNVLGKQMNYDCFGYIWGHQFDDEGHPIDEPCHEIIYRFPKNKAFDVLKNKLALNPSYVIFIL